MRYVIKTRQDYELTDYARAFYGKNNTELSWPIELGVNSDGNQIEQLHNWLIRPVAIYVENQTR